MFSIIFGKRSKKLFNPMDISGLVHLWDSTFGLYQERTGSTASTPSTLVNDPVGTWRSKQGYNFVSSSDATRPKVVNVDGTQYVEFDQIDDVLNGSPTLTVNRPYTLFTAGISLNDGASLSRTLTGGGVNSLLTIANRRFSVNWLIGNVNPVSEPDEHVEAVPASLPKRSVAGVSTLAPLTVAYLDGRIRGQIANSGDWGTLIFGGGEPARAQVRVIAYFNRDLNLSEIQQLHNWSMR